VLEGETAGRGGKNFENSDDIPFPVNGNNCDGADSNCFADLRVNPPIRGDIVATNRYSRIQTLLGDAGTAIHGGADRRRSFARRGTTNSSVFSAKCQSGATRPGKNPSQFHNLANEFFAVQAVPLKIWPPVSEKFFQ
jgi:hypothetical protein